MTMVNVCLDAEAALVCVDTEAVDGSGKVIPGSIGKAFPLPHLSTVVTGRGNQSFLNMVAFACQLAQVDDFDGLDKLLPGTLATCLEQFHAFNKIVDSTAEKNTSRQEFLMVGWSPKNSAMCLVVYVLQEDGKTFVREESSGGGSWLAPWSEAWGPIRTALDLPSMLEIVRVQRRRTSELGAQAAHIGGRALAIEISKKSIRSSTLCVFESIERREPPRDSAGAFIFGGSPQ